MIILVEFAFFPTKEQTISSNIYQFMKKHKISNLNALCETAKKNIPWFWEEVEKDLGVIWDQKYSKVLDLKEGLPWPKWFVGGKTNIINSSIEKMAKKVPDKIAYYFLSENSQKSSITYHQLKDETNRLANGLKSLGVAKGDVVAIYMPMIREAFVAILACAKIGAIQTVIFSGYSSEALKIRLEDCKAKILLVTDGFFRKGKIISQKDAIRLTLKNPILEYIIMVPYGQADYYEESEKIISYQKLISSQSSVCETEIMDSEDPLFILYTSGTTGKPKGVIHTHGGFSVFAGHQAKYLIDLKEDDVLFWPADIGWITGLVWNVYGLLELGATGIIYDGALDWPNPRKIWDYVFDYNVTIFGISPTAVRMFMKNNIEPFEIHDYKKIRIIPTTGEPIDEESWVWLFEKVGKKKLPIMNLSGGTEIGGAMLSVFPGLRLKPTTVGIPCPGMDVDVFDEKGNSIKNQKGFLVVKQAWPGMTKGLLNDKNRYIKTYWSKFENIWFHGDYVLEDKDGLWYMYGRVDDVINVSGHRMSTAEIEQTIMINDKVLEVASISIPDKITGEAIVVFVVLKDGFDKSDIETEIKNFVVKKIGKIAKPKRVLTISDLPKTRTGKIMRRLLRAKYLGEQLGDLSSLENPHVLEEIKA